jgi:nucleotidyltransferase/DNA polymerase involved in DNA repair
MDSELRQLGIETATDLRRQPKGELVHRFGERTGMFLYLAARGRVGIYS